MKREQAPATEKGGSKPVARSGMATPSFQPYRGSGFSAEAAVAMPAAVAKPTPLPKRPKGRLVVALLLLAICALGGYSVWDTFFRYCAHGVIAGNVIEVAAPWDGAVRYLHVTEGETVRQGQVLLTLENLPLQERFEKLGDELRLAQANLEAEVSKLKWDKQWNEDRHQDARVDYYEVWGKLLEEQAKLTQLQLALERTQKLHDRSAVSDAEFEQAILSAQGQRQKVEKLQSALVEARGRVESTAGRTERGSDQLKPKLIAIESLQSEITRVRQLLDQGQVRSPVDGLVIKRHCSAGEQLRAAAPALSILEAGTLEVVLYLPQPISTQYRVGQHVELVVNPYQQRLQAKVTRLGERFEPAPESIARYYRKDQSLLPVHLVPQSEMRPWMALRVGGVVKLPYRWLPESNKTGR